MANIDNDIQKINTARYGEEVRTSIADSIDAMNHECEEIVSKKSLATDYTKVAFEMSPGREVVVPTMDEFNQLNSDLVNLQNKASGTVTKELSDDIDNLNEEVEMLGIIHRINFTFTISRWLGIGDATPTQQSNNLWYATSVCYLEKDYIINIPNNKYMIQLVHFGDNKQVTSFDEFTSSNITIGNDGYYALTGYCKPTRALNSDDIVILKNDIYIPITKSTVIKEMYEKKYIEFESGKGYYVGLSAYGYPDGTKGYTATHKCGDISVVEGERYIINTSVLNKMAPYVIFDADDTVLEIYSNVIPNGVTTLEDIEITMPEGAKKLGLSCYLQNSDKFMVAKIEYDDRGIELDSINLYKDLKDHELGIVSAKPTVINNSQLQNMSFLNPYKYPLLQTWGHEYLSHWYEKVYEANQSATIVLDGDSITEGYDPLYSGVNDAFRNMRGYEIKKIMKAGNYPLSQLTLYNNGHGGRTTNEYIGDATHSNYLITSNNGFIDESMSHNPDLLIIAYGMNDADTTNTKLPSTIEGKLNLYKSNMQEALQRIRGNASVNGRPAYNKPLKDLSIIICNPTVSYWESTGRSNDIWNQYIRIINQDLCREFYCAFADFTLRTYDHKADGSNDWAVLEANGVKSKIHPNKYSNAQITSMLQDLIYPTCMWNIDVD